MRREGKLRYRDLVLDLDRRLLNINGSSIELTNLEFNLLELFMGKSETSTKKR